MNEFKRIFLYLMANSIDTNLVTLSRHVLNEQYKHKGASGDLTLLLVSIQLGCKFVSSQVRRAGLANLYIIKFNIFSTGLAGKVNVIYVL